MIASFAMWWRARTGRERRLIQIAAGLMFFLLLPGLIYSRAAAFRGEAAAEYSNAQRIRAQLDELKAAIRAHPDAAPAGSVRERALAAAQGQGIAIAGLESVGEGRMRVVVEPSDSLKVYKWVEAMGRAGAEVERGAIERVGDSEQVRAEFVFSE